MEHKNFTGRPAEEENNEQDLDHLMEWDEIPTAAGSSGNEEDQGQEFDRGYQELLGNQNNLDLDDVHFSDANEETGAGGSGNCDDDLVLNIPPPDKKQMKLRGYQKELVKLAEEGKNVIVCAPPASGKTIVAAHIILNFLENSDNPRRKVLFFTPGGALAQQQKDRIDAYLSDKYSTDFRCGREEHSSLIPMKETDVIVLTPQILLNELDDKNEVKTFRGIDDFGLIIFDECHHCFKGHPYNGVMRKYFAFKDSADDDNPTNIPQVVGLTATLSVGKNPKDPVKEIKQLCANLDAVDGIVTVRDPANKEELYRHIPHPEKTTELVEDRANGPIYDKIIGLIATAHNNMKEIGITSEPPSYKNTETDQQQYKQWCVELKTEISGSEYEHSRDAVSCVEYLEICGKALDFYFKCQPIDAVECIDEWLENQTVENLNPREKNLYDTFSDCNKELAVLCEGGRCVNPNLELVKHWIVQKFRIKENSRGMVMVETRDYTELIKKWMNRTKELEAMNAEIFIGVANTSNSTVSGLTHNKQQQILTNFREGKHKVLICTPDSAGEGMDVANCNLVINYCFIQNEIGMVQTKGRVRDRDGEMFHLGSKKGVEHDRLNMIKTVLMQEAIQHLQGTIDRDMAGYQENIREIQKESKRMYKIELLKKLSKQPTKSDKEFLLQCRKCKVDICSSYDMRIVKGGHHINITEDFRRKCKTKMHKKKTPMGADWKKKNKVHCLKCECDWGIEAVWKGLVTVPLIRVAGVRIVPKNADKPVFVPNKWVLAPFKPAEVNLDEVICELDGLIGVEEI